MFNILNFIFLSSFFYLINSQYSDKYEALINWLLSNGAYISKKLSPNEINPSNRFIYANKPILKNEHLLIIPNNLIISCINPKVYEICYSIYGKIDGDINYDCLLYFLSLDFNSKNSFFKPFYNYFPILNYNDFPVYMTDEDLNKYNITGVSKEIYFAKKYINDLYDMSSDIVPVEFEIYKKYFLYLSTRNYYRKVNNYELYYMVPYADLFSHSINNNAEYYFDEKNNQFILYAKRNIKKNEEITILYGAYNNIELYVDYGFTIKDNNFKCNVTIDFEGKLYYLNGKINKSDILNLINEIKKNTKKSNKEIVNELIKILEDLINDYNKINNNDNQNMKNIMNEQIETMKEYIKILKELKLD